LQCEYLQNETSQRYEIARDHQPIWLEVVLDYLKMYPPKSYDDHKRYKECEDADGTLHEIYGVQWYHEAESELRKTKADYDVGKRLKAADDPLAAMRIVVERQASLRSLRRIV